MELLNTTYKLNGLKLEYLMENNLLLVTYKGKKHNAIVTDINEKNWILKDLAYQLSLSMKKLKENFAGVEKFIDLIESCK